MKIVNLENIKNSNISGIYKIDFPNRKSYIGQSQNIYRRITQHNRYALKGHGKHNIQLCEQAIQKYGQVKNFIILEENVPLDKLDQRELFWIKYYDTTNKQKGYNITLGGDVSGKRGTTHPNALFSKKQIDEIYDLLIHHTQLSYIDIANKYDVSQMTILRISLGQSYKNEQLSYPLRKNNHDATKKEKVLDYFTSEQILLQLKEDLLYRWDLSIETDLVKKYNIPIKILREINHGSKFQEYGDYNYPIRNKNIRNNHNFSQQDILNILNDLKNSSLNMTQIGKKYNIHRDTVSKINKGQTYLIKNYDYPARKT